jgi:hypothetical protein
MLFDAHKRSFAALGGLARFGIRYNIKTAADKVKKGKGRIVNERFATMFAHYLGEPDFCNVASGWEKGVVEKNMQDSRRDDHGQPRLRRVGRAFGDAKMTTRLPRRDQHSPRRSTPTLIHGKALHTRPFQAPLRNL